MDVGPLEKPERTKPKGKHEPKPKREKPKTAQVEFFERCQEAIRLLGGENVAWHVGDLFNLPLDMDVKTTAITLDLSLYFFGIRVYEDDTLADDIIELRSDNGDIVSIIIPDRERGKGRPPTPEPQPTLDRDKIKRPRGTPIVRS